MERHTPAESDFFTLPAVCRHLAHLPAPGVVYHHAFCDILPFPLALSNVSAYLPASRFHIKFLTPRAVQARASAMHSCHPTISLSYRRVLQAPFNLSPFKVPSASKPTPGRHRIRHPCDPHPSSLRPSAFQLLSLWPPIRPDIQDAVQSSLIRRYRHRDIPVSASKKIGSNPEHLDL